MKLPVIQKYDLQVILQLSIQFPNNNEYFEEICLNGHESIHHLHPSFYINAIVKDNMSI